MTISYNGSAMQYATLYELLYASKYKEGSVVSKFVRAPNVGHAYTYEDASLRDSHFISNSIIVCQSLLTINFQHELIYLFIHVISYTCTCILLK